MAQPGFWSLSVANGEIIIPTRDFDNRLFEKKVGRVWNVTEKSRTSCLGLPPGVHNRYLALANFFVVPLPCLWIDGFSNWKLWSWDRQIKSMQTRNQPEPRARKDERLCFRTWLAPKQKIGQRGTQVLTDYYLTITLIRTTKAIINTVLNKHSNCGWGRIKLCNFVLFHHLQEHQTKKKSYQRCSNLPVSAGIGVGGNTFKQ